MSNSWTFTTFEKGRPVARHERLSNEATAIVIARALNPLFDVEDVLGAAERGPQREGRAA